MYSWLIKNISDGFDFVSVLKQSDLSCVKLYRNKNTGQKVIVRYIKDGIEIYEKLLKISNKHIPTIYEVARDPEKEEAVVIEEYISGMTVGDVLESGCYSEEGTRIVVRALCDALMVLHSMNIVHRDIKPENIIISDSGDVYLIDYNSSREYKNDALKDTHILGTHGFAAPEQYGIGQTDFRTDIYAVGVLMNVMLTGEHPTQKMYEGKLSKVINKCIQSNPDRRYKNVGELRERL